ncbi:MAG: diguanylate cyclase, partial [Burkholderiaceae bacterium]|nr:diguanylate cyclase [Burkholderiaceae bacterium]
MAWTVSRIKVSVWALAALFLAVLLGAAGTLAWTTRQTALENRMEQVKRFVSGAEAALNNSFLTVDLLLSGTDDLLGLSTSMGDWIDASVSSKLLDTVTRGNLLVRFTALLDREGRVLASSDPSGARHAVQLPPEFLQAALAPSAPSLLVSTPTVSFNSTQVVLYFARPLALANGHRLVVVAQVPVAKMAQVLMQGADSAGLEVVLERSNGSVLLSIPDWGEQALLRPIQPLNTPAESATWGAPARLSGVPALVVSRPLLYQNLRLSASLPEEVALEDWRAERNAIAVVTAVFCLMVLLAAGAAVAFFHSVTMARQAMAHSKTMLDQALESMVSGFVLLDQRGRVVHWNRRFAEIYPWLAGVMAPQLPFRKVLEKTVKYHLPQADEAKQQQWVEQRLARQRSAAGGHEQTTPDGRHIQILERSTPEGGLVITYHDVTDLRRATAEIETLAFYDPLTGLPNRTAFVERLNTAIAECREGGSCLAVFFVDLDQFKMLNDTKGHHAGDSLLVLVARRLEEVLGPDDVIARLGGDEFVVMVPYDNGTEETVRPRLLELADNIQAALARPFVIEGLPFRTSASIGVSC